MTRIDFYLLSNPADDGRLDLVAKLAEKASGSGQKVYIYSTDNSELTALDRHLWTFRWQPDSHVARGELSGDPLTLQHAPLSGSDDPVLLGNAEPSTDRQILINLHTEVPPFFSRFQRTLEVIGAAAGDQSSGRERYRYYQSRGYPLKHHKL